MAIFYMDTFRYQVSGEFKTRLLPCTLARALNLVVLPTLPSDHETCHDAFEDMEEKVWLGSSSVTFAFLRHYSPVFEPVLERRLQRLH